MTRMEAEVVGTLAKHDKNNVIAKNVSKLIFVFKLQV